MASSPVRLALLALLVALAGCAARTPDVTLSEMENTQVDATSVGLGAIEEQKIWKSGKRVTVVFATVLVRSATSGTIERQRVWPGDDVRVGDALWTVVAIERGTATTRGRVLLRKKD